jgi:hypothetical protein
MNGDKILACRGNMKNVVENKIVTRVGIIEVPT